MSDAVRPPHQTHAQPDKDVQLKLLQDETHNDAVTVALLLVVEEFDSQLDSHCSALQDHHA